MISGKPVRSVIERTGTPALDRDPAVPPVEMISTPRSASPRANSTMPVLSDTDRRARRIFGPGAASAASSTGSTSSAVAMRPTLPTLRLGAGGCDQHPTGVGWIEADRTVRDQHHSLRQEL